MIKVDHLAKRYADVYAVDDISFEVKQGEILGLLGPNGAGKTTTMRILTCYMPATSGTATVAGYDVFRDSIDVRRQIGYLPENVPLYPEMRVKEYLLFRAKLKKLPYRERKSKIDECLEKCRITDVQNQIIGTLSKGYRQRVGLADTLVHDPKILILDEPTIGLDPNQIRQVRQLIKELGEKHTILLSTHILPEVEMICGRVIIINKGKIVAMDTPSNLATQLRSGNNITLEVRGNGEKIKNALSAIKGVKKVVWHDEGEFGNFVVEAERGVDVREDVFVNVVKNNGIIREMKQASITLEEIFHQITMQEQEVTA
ncbi:MAG: ATP-binding cassette domain-containing protein [Candidatus Brocadia sp. AMX2]|uniref:Antibiotic transport system ATP-binding protein n=1 Tax=Candidatus Brocadia sinica JPN1 TaxID=1197129 RepID=A0ABQ0JX32_9BACT|nr:MULTISPECIES: ATP-binding cassette domain-containing protein [Brocadia]KXK30370.1 MAG: ABC transporter ATP-binding component [Candidatus Brocadia sinica]MBC6931049.1 ATP-binding cassette domain-containing protein [Candidatus Brocadia sp.]MBL1168174.1 ATP-binding cassette domain-containing protein [Candidatus Brocadia sp. AMX1]NOG40946.1 ATP-binding cassette domain-containing protein [Planctomycetota bacterium]KAA0244286.1 MAG: ATP-binding cassette domain-containing protein [Candidatus Broca